MIILVMKLAQEETLARYDGCCNQLLLAKITQKIILHKIKLSQSYRKCKKEKNAIRFFKSILYFIEEKSFFLQIMYGDNNRGQQCSEEMQKGGGM